MPPNGFPSVPPRVWPYVTTFTLECYMTIIPMFLNFGFQSLSWQIFLVLSLVCLARKWHFQTGLNTSPRTYNLGLFRFRSWTHQWSEVDSPEVHLGNAGKLCKLSHKGKLRQPPCRGKQSASGVWNLASDSTPPCSLHAQGKNTSNQVFWVNDRIVHFQANFL